MSKLDKYLIPQWRKWYKLWSIRLGAAGVTLLGFMEAFPNAAFHVWLAIPADLRAYLPADTIRWFAIGLTAAALIARIIRQYSLDDAADEKPGGTD